MLLLTYATTLPPAAQSTSPLPRTACVTIPSRVTRLQNLYYDAVTAVHRLNEALAASSPATLRAADLPPRFNLYAPESAYPIPCVLGPTVTRRDPPYPHTRDTLAKEARRLGMSRAEIRRRFGLPSSDHGPLKPAKATPQQALPSIDDILSSL